MIQGATLSACSAWPVTSTHNSVIGTVNSETPQARQTKTSGKTQTAGLLAFFRPGKWMAISAGNLFWLTEPHDGHAAPRTDAL